MDGPWWRRAVIYQVYPRSFADSDGDGVGDLGGIRSRLPYLRDLGVDALWLSPFYPSPQAAARGRPARARYLFRDGAGPDGSAPPNNWMSNFGGRAWTRVPGPDGAPGQWYLHLFTPQQPDLDWTNAEVRAEF